MVRLTIDLGGKDATFISTSYRLHSGLSTLDIYRSPPERLPNTDQLKEAIDRLQLAFEGGTTGNRVQIALRRKARKEVTEMFQKIVRYLESVATEDDVPALIQAGFEVRRSAFRKRIAPVPVT